MELTIDKLRKVSEFIKAQIAPPYEYPYAFIPYQGLKIYEDSSMTTTITEYFEVSIPWEERWLHPMLHPVTVPFEPWVKTKLVPSVRTIPSKSILQTSYGLIMHPDIKTSIVSALGTCS